MKGFGLCEVENAWFAASMVFSVKVLNISCSNMTTYGL